MRILVVATLIALIMSPVAKSQDILPARQNSDSNRHLNTAFIVIKGDEIRRFPSAHFMDAINGIFPWVFTPYSKANDFTFVVNGFMLTDINSISLNDIDEVIFSRDNLYGSQFPFSKAGTFIIKTKTGKSEKLEINFNSQYNHRWNEDRYVPASGFRISSKPEGVSNMSNNDPGYFISNHLSVSRQGKKMGILFSAQVNSEKSVELNQNTIFRFSLINDTIKGSTVNKSPDQRLFLNVTYKFSDRLDAGIMANYSHSRWKIDTTYKAAYGGRTDFAGNSDARLNYYAAGAFINYKLLKNLSNTLWLEYAYDTITASYYNIASYLSLGSQAYQGVDSSSVRPRNKRYTIRDQLKYDFVNTKKINADLSVGFVYLRHDAEESRGRTIRFSTGGWSNGYSWYLFKEKIASLNPSLNFALQKIVSAYAGANILIGKKVFKNVEKKDKTRFYGGLTADFVQPLKLQKVFSHLGLSFHYADLLQNISNYQWMGSMYDPSRFSPLPVLSPYPADNYQVNIARQQFITANLTVTSANNRFQFIGGWSRLRWERPYVVRFFPNITYVIPGQETRQGLSFEFAGKIVDQSVVKWKNSFSLFFPDTKIDQPGISSGETVDKSTLRAGMQNRIDYKNFFLQANVLVDIDHAYYIPDTYPVRAEKHNDISLNYILLGYRPGISKTSRFKDVCVFVQARNVFVSKQFRENYIVDHYAGAGVNLSF